MQKAESTAATVDDLQSPLRSLGLGNDSSSFQSEESQPPQHHHSSGASTTRSPEIIHGHREDPQKKSGQVQRRPVHSQSTMISGVNRPDGNAPPQPQTRKVPPHQRDYTAGTRPMPRRDEANQHLGQQTTTSNQQVHRGGQSVQSAHSRGETAPKPRAAASRPASTASQTSFTRSTSQNHHVHDQSANGAQSSNQRHGQSQDSGVFTGPSQAQVDFLNRLASTEVPKASISSEELDEKENLRLLLQATCRDAITQHELQKNEHFDAASVALKCFGSLSTGFATHSSDMDLALVSPNSKPDPSSPESEIPRLLEKVLLDSGFGARLLTRTRVPIIKFCEKPTPVLAAAVLEERAKWEKERSALPIEAPDTVMPPDLHRTQEGGLVSTSVDANAGISVANEVRSDAELISLYRLAMNDGWYDVEERKIINNFVQAVEKRQSAIDDANVIVANARLALRSLTDVLSTYRSPPDKHLNFPKNGVGVQCDINFSNHLALHNTRLLRCYSLCDSRVRPIVMFVKIWAKRRKINSPYGGTLSSYGYVLMVLHYLANVVDPPVIPNLQTCRKAFQDKSPENDLIVDGHGVRFWRSENEIRDLARRKMLSRNVEDTVGIILCGFFHYFAHQNQYAPAGGFSWSQDVLSLRTPGGLLRKRTKGWTSARSVTVEQNPSQGVREIRHRYLLAIEDPFEIEHNIARTVGHPGIVAIRDEFRRAVSIIQSVGSRSGPVEDLFAEERERELWQRRTFGPMRTDSATTGARCNPSFSQNGKGATEAGKGNSNDGKNGVSLVPDEKSSKPAAKPRQGRYRRNFRSGNSSVHTSSTAPQPSASIGKP